MLPITLLEMQIKLRYHYTFIKWFKSRTLTLRDAGVFVEQQECKMIQPCWKACWQFLTKLNILTIGFSNHTPWHFLKGTETLHTHRKTTQEANSFFNNC